MGDNAKRLPERRVGPVVEFVGLPNSGKTHFAKILVSELLRNSPRVAFRHFALADTRPLFLRHAIRARYVLSTAVRCPRPFAIALKLIATDRQQSAYRFARVAWNLWCVMGWYGWLSRHHSGPIVADQGLVQAIWSIRVSAQRNIVDWTKFMATHAPVDLVVAIHNDSSTTAGVGFDGLESYSLAELQSALQAVRASSISTTSVIEIQNFPGKNVAHDICSLLNRISCL